MACNFILNLFQSGLQHPLVAEDNNSPENLLRIQHSNCSIPSAALEKKPQKPSGEAIIY